MEDTYSNTSRPFSCLLFCVCIIYLPFIRVTYVSNEGPARQRIAANAVPYPVKPVTPQKGLSSLHIGPLCLLLNLFSRNELNPLPSSVDTFVESVRSCGSKRSQTWQWQSLLVTMTSPWLNEQESSCLNVRTSRSFLCYRSAKAGQTVGEWTWPEVGLLQ